MNIPKTSLFKLIIFFTETSENITVGGEEPRVDEEFSPIIHQAAFNESDDCLKLNTTLEEIERMLNEGSDNSHESQYTNISSNEPCSSVNLNSSCISEVLPNTMQIISGSFSQSPVHTNLEKLKTPNKTAVTGRKPTPRKLKSPTKICYNFKTEESSNRKKEEIGNKMTTPIGEFRIPKTPVKPKPTVLNNKNIVSPVGIYIKYSPKTPLTTYVKPNECKKGVISHIPQSPKIIKTTKENRDVLPPVVYQPAKNKLFTMQEQLILPASIDKMVKKSNVIKHEKRVKMVIQDEHSVQRKLNMETELTKASISDSLLDENNQDVSVLMSKQAFRK